MLLARAVRVASVPVARAARVAPVRLAPAARVASLRLAVAALAALAIACAGLPPAPAAGSEGPGGAGLSITGFSLEPTEGGQAPEYVNRPYRFTQAGGHPVALTSRIDFSTEQIGETLAPTRDPRNLAIDLPPGLIATPAAIPACPYPEGTPCPSGTQVGTFVLSARYEKISVRLLGPLVNLTPGPGEAARLGMETPLGRFLLSGHLVYTPAGYSLALTVTGLPVLGVVSIETTLWGVPAAHAHDAERGLTCIAVIGGGGGWTCPIPSSGASGVAEADLLTMPSDCSDPAPTATAWVDSWESPQEYAQATVALAAPTGCDRLPFQPSFQLQPDSSLAEAPVGIQLSFHLSESESPLALAPPPLRAAAVVLAPGLALNPAFAAAAQACPPSGPKGIDLPSGVAADGAPLSPFEVGEGEQFGADGLARLAPGNCPAASTIGTAEARSPALVEPLTGRVYLSAPGCGGAGQRPCGEADAADGQLFGVYIELGGRGARRDQGAIVKLAARVRASPATGQLTLELPETPQLPLSELRFDLLGGEGAVLTNPSSCGPATTSADLRPWTTPSAAGASPSSYYEVGGCAPSTPFAPTLVAGSVDPAAGAASAFTMSLQREPREQDLARLQLRAPTGVSAALAGVPRCAEPAAAAGECPPSSRIGGATVLAGSGWQPLVLGGDVYLTGPYAGAPFGLSIVADARAGPIDLGRVTLRARIDIDPDSGALTITSDPLPQILLGVPLRLRGLRLDIERPGFMLNPTACTEKRVEATVASAQGAIATPSDPFAVAGCRSLSFAPRLSASTSGRASIATGASLDVKLAEPAGTPGTEANLAKLRIALPRALAIRLSALRGSCPAPTFAADPARCPASSVVGVARARTPLLSSSLSGPVYLVAHGRSAFPAPVVVLQGEGVALRLLGASTIERGDVTAIAFAGLPDVPLRSVELYLPRGPHAAFAPAADLCAAAPPRKGGVSRLPLASELVAQNGAVLHRTAQIAVLGCPPLRSHGSQGSHGLQGSHGSPGSHGRR